MLPRRHRASTTTPKVPTRCTRRTRAGNQQPSFPSPLPSLPSPRLTPWRGAGDGSHAGCGERPLQQPDNVGLEQGLAAGGLEAVPQLHDHHPALACGAVARDNAGSGVDQSGEFRMKKWKEGCCPSGHPPPACQRNPPPTTSAPSIPQPLTKRARAAPTIHSRTLHQRHQLASGERGSLQRRLLRRPRSRALRPAHTGWVPS